MNFLCKTERKFVFIFEKIEHNCIQLSFGHVNTNSRNIPKDVNVYYHGQDVNFRDGGIFIFGGGEYDICYKKKKIIWLVRSINNNYRVYVDEAVEKYH